MSNAIREVVTKTEVTFDGFNMDNEFQKAGTKTAQLRQAVTTDAYYPSKRVDNEMNGGLFGASAFGFEEQKFTNTENRVAWILIPPAMTEADVLAELKVKNAQGACIYRVLSSAPIISKDQQWSINKGLRTLDDYANSQVMRYPTGHEQEGELILFNGKAQYRKTFFWPVPRPDEDLRATETAYVSPDIQAELTGASSFAGQSIS